MSVSLPSTINPNIGIREDYITQHYTFSCSAPDDKKGDFFLLNNGHTCTFLNSSYIFDEKYFVWSVIFPSLLLHYRPLLLLLRWEYLVLAGESCLHVPGEQVKWSQMTEASLSPLLGSQVTTGVNSIKWASHTPDYPERMPLIGKTELFYVSLFLSFWYLCGYNLSLFLWQCAHLFKEFHVILRSFQKPAPGPHIPRDAPCISWRLRRVNTGAL